jgi:TonB family protein
MKTSIALHALLVALILLGGSAAHHFVPVPAVYPPTLVFPLELPVPHVKPVTMRSHSALVTTGAAVLNITQSHPQFPEAPAMAASLVPAELPILPVTAGDSVNAAPQAKIVGFGSGSGGDSTRGNGKVLRVGFERPAAPLAPRVLFIPHAHYTDAARAAGISGAVVLRVLLKADGTVSILGVVRSLSYGMDESAEKSALGIEFVPGTVDHQAIVTVEFDIS